MRHLETLLLDHRAHAVLRLLLVFAWSASASLVHAQCAASNLIENGDLTGSEGESHVAPGWTGISSPDLNDENGPVNTTNGYDWVDTPVASPSGGTWQNMTGSEGVSQSVATVIGETYLLCFEHAQTGIASNSYNYDQPFAVNVLVDDETVLVTPVEPNSFAWQTSCVEFMATSTLTVIQFDGDGTETYGAVDGVCLTLVTTGINSDRPPIPFTVYPDPVVRGAPLFTSVPLTGMVATDAFGRRTPLPVSGRSIDISLLEVGAYYLEGRTAQNRRMSARLLVISQ